MNWSLTFAPLVPLPVVIAVAVIAALLILPGIFRRMRGAWLRALAAVALVAALANPVLLNEDREPLTTVVALVVDKSASQSLENRDKVTAEAEAQLKERLAQFHGIEVRTVEAAATRVARRSTAPRCSVRSPPRWPMCRRSASGPLSC